MGAACGGGTGKEKDGKDASKRSKELDRAIRTMQQQDQQVNKLLLLGAGESGKSTLFKQMLLIYGTGFTPEELRGYVPVIHANVVTAMKTLLVQAEALAAEFNTTVNPALSSSVAFVQDMAADQSLDRDAVHHIDKLWKDAGIQETFSHRAKFQLSDSTDYFMHRLNDLIAPNWLPTEQDVLRARVRTTGIVENDFEIEGNKFKILDVGGQRSERKKWIHCFSDVTAVIFVAAISEYDQVLFEDESVNRMDEALNLFDEICNSRFFTKNSMILMLNKRDLFAEKLQSVPLSVAFPEYDGDNSYDDACAYVQDLFLSRRREKNKVVYVHVTCATDTTAMKIVFDAVKDIIIRRSLAEGGLLS